MQHYISLHEEDCQQVLSEIDDQLQTIMGKPMEIDLFILAIIEALNNALEHGNKRIPGLKVVVDSHVTPSFAYVAVKDDGMGFEPVFPCLELVKGPRGRGLGLIRNESDHLFFDQGGRQIIFWKQFDRESKMKVEVTGQCSFERHDLGSDSLLITHMNIKKSSMVCHAFTDIFKDQVTGDTRFVMIDCTGITVLSSLAWGVLIDFLNHPSREQVILFNSSPAIMHTAENLGLLQEESPYPNLKILQALPSEILN